MYSNVLFSFQEIQCLERIYEYFFELFPVFNSLAALLSLIPGQSIHRRQGSILRCRNSVSTGVSSFTQCSLQGPEGRRISGFDCITVMYTYIKEGWEGYIGIS